MELFTIIQSKVDKLAKEIYKTDSCPPEFIVSNYQVENNEGKIVDHKIMLTVRHNGISHSRVLFPKVRNNYGYDDIKEEMKWLYNSTM